MQQPQARDAGGDIECLIIDGVAHAGVHERRRLQQLKQQRLCACWGEHRGGAVSSARAGRCPEQPVHPKAQAAAAAHALLLGCQKGPREGEGQDRCTGCCLTRAATVQPPLGPYHPCARLEGIHACTALPHAPSSCLLAACCSITAALFLLNSSHAAARRGASASSASRAASTCKVKTGHAKASTRKCVCVLACICRIEFALAVKQ